MNASANGMVVFATGWRAAALALLLALAPASKAEMPGEYAVKAAFLYNFIAFTEWPDAVFETPASPFVIGVLGDDPFGSSLDAMMNGERIKERPVVIRRFKRLEDMHRCHVLFISASEAKRVTQILHQLKNQPVLTTSDMTYFAEAGGAIGFTTSSSVKLTINQSALQTAKLTISAKLLRLARVVDNKAFPR